MSHSYRHYRQVKIINNGQQSSPKIDGFEEIVCDGKKQVYYWNEPTDRSRWDDSELSFSSLIDPDYNWLDIDEFFNGVRYLNPHEVIIRDLTYPQTTIKHQNSKLFQLKRSIQNGVNNLKKIAKRLPLAFRAAWRELTSDY
ncbi:hypothetical protein cce_0652 [Crocosphaera subtropica ATCC 51142]|uniref:Uncharacterized protein n=1 Tax=Crocosphaera subtropica (strain ATCC 51142 / BH68) TaxID=43989 RepID=B1WQ81_CROS5|nr:hypothetical protein [Crocosphaera subtropica]ACB50003.1 hypothetical protein cce_0652 [Crocosphaera subtropica ATCC 51142]